MYYVYVYVLRTTTYYYVLLRTTTYYYVLLRITTYDYVRLRTTTYYCVLLRTTYTYYYVLLRTTTYYYVLLRTTTYYVYVLRTTYYYVLYVLLSLCADTKTMTCRPCWDTHILTYQQTDRQTHRHTNINQYKQIVIIHKSIETYSYTYTWLQMVRPPPTHPQGGGAGTLCVYVVSLFAYTIKMIYLPCVHMYIHTYKQTINQYKQKVLIHKSIQTYSYTYTWLQMVRPPPNPPTGGGAGTLCVYVISLFAYTIKMTCRPCLDTYIHTYKQTINQYKQIVIIHKSIETFSYTYTWLQMVRPPQPTHRGGGAGTLCVHVVSLCADTKTMTFRPCLDTYIHTYKQTINQYKQIVIIHKSIETYSYTYTWLQMVRPPQPTHRGGREHYVYM